MKLDGRTRELIAVGASITANCQPCPEYHSKKVPEVGADGEEIAEAIESGKQVRKGVAAKMDESIAEWGKPASCCQPAKAPSFGCCS